MQYLVLDEDWLHFTAGTYPWLPLRGLGRNTYELNEIHLLGAACDRRKLGRVRRCRAADMRRIRHSLFAIVLKRVAPLHAAHIQK